MYLGSTSRFHLISSPFSSSPFVFKSQPSTTLYMYSQFYCIAKLENALLILPTYHYCAAKRRIAKSHIYRLVMAVVMQCQVADLGIRKGTRAHIHSVDSAISKFMSSVHKRRPGCVSTRNRRSLTNG